jgi:small-conductance mechanosensitive channel
MHLQHLFERIGSLATDGPLAIPIWFAFLLILLSFLRGPLLTGILRWARVQDETLVADVRKRIDVPLQLLFIGLALLPFTFMVPAPYGTYVEITGRIFVIFLALHIAIQTIDLAVFSWYLKKSRQNVSAVMRFFALTVLYGIVFMLLLEWGIGVSVLPLLATSTVLTAVLGLALQDTLKNAFAGLNMSLENSFEQGDWVMLRPGSSSEWFGQIVEIGWRTTKIKTLNNNYAVIPNASFTAYELINFNKPTNLHARVIDIPVMFGADPEKVGLALRKAALSVAGILEDPSPQPLATLISNDRVVYQLRFWMADIAQREVLTGRVIQRCWEELKDLGALY